MTRRVRLSVWGLLWTCVACQSGDLPVPDTSELVDWPSQSVPSITHRDLPRVDEDDTTNPSGADTAQAPSEDSGPAVELPRHDGSPTPSDAHHDDVSSDGHDSAPSPVDPGPSSPPIIESSLNDVQNAIEAAFSDSANPGHTLSALVTDAETGQVLYSLNAAQTLKPASNTKLFTTAAAIALLGEDHRFITRVFRHGSLNNEGTLNGDLILMGDHDPTWSTEFYTSPSFPLAELSATLWDSGLRQVTGTIAVYGEVLWDGYRYGTYNAESHRVEVSERFRDALASQGITLSGTLSTHSSFDPPEGATEWARWSSIPLGVICNPINRISHNEMADILLRHLGYVKTATSSYAAGQEQVLEFLNAVELSTDGIAFNDGSGLSHDNRVSAAQIVALTRYMRQHETGSTWLSSLAIAGVSGTLQGRMPWDETRGRVFGKTGTLNGVIATSGVLMHRSDGMPYTFAILMNAVSDASEARAAQDAAIRAFSAPLRGDAPRPGRPVLRSVRNLGDGQGVRATWSPAAGAMGYRVWRSPDAKRWSRADAIWTEETTLTLGANAGSDIYVRVTAASAGGESAPSDVYGARVTQGPSPVLIVDGNDRWELEPSPENTLGRGHDVVALHGRAMGSWSFDSCADEAVVDGHVSLADYQIVVWSLGEESTVHETLSDEAQARVTGWLNNGGALFISGAELGWDLDHKGSASDRSFYETWLKATYLSDDANTFTVRSGPGPFSELPIINFYTPGRALIDYADRLGAKPGASGCLSYAEGSGGYAAICYAGTWRVIHLGFPFENIDNAPDRSALMYAALEYLAP